MSILALLLAVLATAIVIYLAPRLPAPFPLVVYAVVVILWIVALAMLLPIDMGARVG